MKEKFENLFEKIDCDTKFIFLVSALMAFFCHLFLFVNRFANEDDLLELIVEKNMISVGRWMPGNLFSKYTLPVVLFVLVIIGMGIISVLINKLFKLKNRTYKVIVSMFICTFPVLALSFGYTFMIEQYAISLLLSVVAVWAVDKWKYGWLIGSLLLTLSMGYYQSYVTVSIALILMLIIKKILKDNANLKENLKFVFKYLLMGLIGVALYLIITRLVCSISGINLSMYKGIDSLGSLPPLEKMRHLFLRTYGHVGYFILGRKYFAPMEYALIPQIVLALSNLIFVILLMVQKKLRKSNLIILTILLCLFPFGINLLDFLLYESTISSLNIYQFVFIFIMPFILLDAISKEKKIRRTYKILSFVSCVLAFVLIWNNFSISNLYYMKMSDYNKSTELLVNRVVDRVESFAGSYDSEQKVLFGIKEGIYKNQEKSEYEKYFLYDQGLWNRFIGFSTMADYDDYKVHLMIKNLTGIEYKNVSNEERLFVIESDEYKEMPSWPDVNCIKEINDVLVVKIS